LNGEDASWVELDAPLSTRRYSQYLDEI